MISFIDFNVFKTAGSFPRCPDNLELLIDSHNIDRNESFIVYVSHTWFRHDVSDEHPSPDNELNEKHNLCVEGITYLKNTLAPAMSKCYLWIDYSCSNQNEISLNAMLQIESIIALVDCIFTPVCGTWSNIKDVSVQNWYTEYDATQWSGLDIGYTHRAWCRLELLAAAFVPVVQRKGRAERFRGGLRHAALHRRRRPHFLYGSTECSTHAPPKLLPPLRTSHLSTFDPRQGCLLREEDREVVSSLTEQILALLPTEVLGWNGAYDANGKWTGDGVLHLENGDVYEGAMENGLFQGVGTYKWVSGDVYRGDHVLGRRTGKGVLYMSSGEEFQGTFENSMRARNGFGKFTDAEGNVYEGEYLNGKWNGEGTYKTTLGDVFFGNWVNNKKQKGIMRYATGSVYEGSYLNDKRQGPGVFTSSVGEHYEGEWDLDKQEGSGVYLYANGDVYTGDWVDGLRIGNGVMKYANGDTWTGAWEYNVRHGHGQLVLVSREVVEGVWKEDNKVA